MHPLEERIRPYCIASPRGKFVPAPMPELLRGYALDPVSSGLQARVFRVRGEPWVIKEGRWDLEIGIAPGMTLPLYAKLTERLLSVFSFTFLPRRRLVRRQHAQYRTFLKYFGCFDALLGESPWFLPDLDRLVADQRAVRAGLAAALPDLERRYRVHLDGAADLFRGPVVRHNFLPKEYLLFGEPISPQNKGHRTFFIMQEFVEGRPLHDVGVGGLGPEERLQMVLLLTLVLLMHRDAALVPDTRPRYIFLQAHDWLTKTDNIFVTDRGLAFIDTRWFWETNANLVRRGLLIPDLTLRWTVFTLQQLLRHA